MERIGHYIGGKHVPGESGRRGPVFDPATGEQTHEVDFADTAELGMAVETAREALPAWRATSLSKRADIMFRIRELLEARKTDVATVLTSQRGKGALRTRWARCSRGLENVEYATGIRIC
jgi:malonate-semialdehyde dehydrogenase (acetylating)/methylmalonate-semialdehyde dehydrogenase